MPSAQMPGGCTWVPADFRSFTILKIWHRGYWDGPGLEVGGGDLGGRSHCQDPIPWPDMSFVPTRYTSKKAGVDPSRATGVLGVVEQVIERFLYFTADWCVDYPSALSSANREGNQFALHTQEKNSEGHVKFRISPPLGWRSSRAPFQRVVLKQALGKVLLQDLWRIKVAWEEVPSLCKMHCLMGSASSHFQGSCIACFL